MISRIVLVMMVALLAVAVAGCGSSDGGSGGSRMKVVAAFYPLSFAAEQIGGDTVEVVNLTPAGAEPHDLELSAGDVRDVNDADLVLYLGGGFQPALERALDARERRSVDLQPDGADPHVWLDPQRYASLAERIGDALGRSAAASAFAGRLLALDRELRRGLRHCARHTIVTSHAAFGYLARRYDLVQVALTGISPETEPSAREIERLVDTVRRTGATTVFFETLVSPDLARTVAREAGVQTAVLDPIEGLTGDALERGEDYFSVMRANLRALQEALGCR